MLTKFSISSFLSQNLKKIRFEIGKTGNPGDLIIQFRDFDSTNNKPGSNILATVTVVGSSIPAGDSAVEITAPSLPASTISIAFKANGGDANNYYAIKWRKDLPYGSWTSSDGGATWTNGPNSDAVIRIEFLIEARRPGSLIASGSIAPTSVSSLPTYHTIALSPAFFILPEEEIILVEKTTGGDGANYYDLYHLVGFTDDGGGYFEDQGYALKSSDGGSTWSPDVGSDGYGATQIGRLGDQRFKLNGANFVKLYSSTLTNTSTINAATARQRLTVEAKATDYTVEIAGVIAGKKGSATTTSTGYVELTVFSENTDIPQGSVEWAIYANGFGFARNAAAQRFAYFGKNPLYPRDLGFSELYMIRAEGVDADSLVIINDNDAGAIYFPNPGDTYTPPANLRVPIRKIEVMQGRATIDLLGIR